MKNTNVVVSLDTRKQKKDGTFPLILRLGHINRTTAIPLNISLKKNEWDEERRQIKKSYTGSSSITRLNNMIQKRKAEALDIILKLKETNQLTAVSLTELRSKIEGVSSENSFFKYTESIIEELYKSNRIGTARSYKCLLGVLKRFVTTDISFEQINYSFLLKFETYHKNKGNEANSLAVYMRTIRAIYNKAIKEKIIERQFYPFADYKIKTVPTEKRALDLELLKIIITLNLPNEHTCFHARNYFVASYMMYGMNYTDMAYLKKTNITSGRIMYRRKKTSKLYDIKVSDSLNAILSFYSIQNPTSEYIFPIIKRNTLLLQNKDIQWSIKRYNKKLKLLAKECGIEHNLTSYVSRHSFATQAMLQQVPLNAISAMLGHSSIKTTEIYLKSLPTQILDEYNSKILSFI